MAVFDQIKDSIDIVDVVEKYGLQINRHGKALCPFHEEKTPSFSIKGQHWHCFGCNEGGDVIDFISRIQCISIWEAAKRLDSDYGLNLFTDKPNQPKQLEQYQQDDKLYTAFKKWQNNAYQTLCGYYRLLQNDKANYTPQSVNKDIHLYFANACHKLDYIYYLISCLFEADFLTRLDFFKTHRKEVNEFADIIKKRRDCPA